MRAVTEVASVRFQNRDDRAGDYREKAAAESAHARTAGACARRRRPPTKSNSERGSLPSARRACAGTAGQWSALQSLWLLPDICCLGLQDYLGFRCLLL